MTNTQGFTLMWPTFRLRQGVNYHITNAYLKRKRSKTEQSVKQNSKKHSTYEYNDAYILKWFYFDVSARKVAMFDSD